MKLAYRNLTITELKQLQWFLIDMKAHINDSSKRNNSAFLCIFLANNKDKLNNFLYTIIEEEIKKELHNQRSFSCFAYNRFISKYSKKTFDKIYRTKGQAILISIGNDLRLTVVNKWITQTTNYLNKRIAKQER